VRIGVFGTGIVGRTLGGKLVEIGHEIMLGSRSADNEAARDWAAGAGDGASHGLFAEAAAFGELLFNCTAGTASLAALASCEPGDLADKVLVDVANPLDFSQGMPPTLGVANTDSLGEQIQREYADAKVVKALNTMNCSVMVDPGRVPGEHDAFLAGDDEGAKTRVRELLASFGWPDDRMVDLGDIGAARGMEMYLPLWLRLFRAAGTADFNIHVVR
jgi:predicted dinucleotide-binding enzyme